MSLVRTMLSWSDVKLVAPVPRMLPGMRWHGVSSALPRADTIDDLAIEHPRTWFLPAIADVLEPTTYALGLRKRLRRSIADSELVVVHYGLPDGAAMARLLQRGKQPWVLHVHGSDVLGCSARGGSIERQLIGALRSATAVVAPTQYLAAKTRELAGTPAGEVIPNIVDPRVFRPRDRATLRGRLGWEQQALHLCYVGNLKASKGVALLPDVLTALGDRQRKAVLHVVGSGPLRSALVERSAQLPAGTSIDVTGALPSAEVADVMSACDALLLPSLSEGFGLVVAESVACGTPAVGFNIPSLRELGGRLWGLVLVDGERPSDLAEGVRRAIAQRSDPQQLHDSTAAFRPDTVGRKLQTVYRRAMTS